MILGKSDAFNGHEYRISALERGGGKSWTQLFGYSYTASMKGSGSSTIKCSASITIPASNMQTVYNSEYETIKFVIRGYATLIIGGTSDPKCGIMAANAATSTTGKYLSTDLGQYTNYTVVTSRILNRIIGDNMYGGTAAPFYNYPDQKVYGGADFGISILPDGSYLFLSLGGSTPISLASNVSGYLVAVTTNVSKTATSTLCLEIEIYGS